MKRLITMILMILSLTQEAYALADNETYTDSVTGMEFVLVKGGCYRMGDTFGVGYPDEKPVHEVCADSFYMGKYEVTQGQWSKIMGSNQSLFSDGDNFPAERISWDEAKEFINKLNAKTGNKYSLPTEAQWEYACRSGGKDEKYSGGGEVEKYAWYEKNSRGRTHSAGRRQSNNLGLFDMSGNVWEWVDDVYDKKAYNKHSHNNPVNTGSSEVHVMRGGSWHFSRRYVRCSYRSFGAPAYRDIIVGFRLILEK